MRADQSRVKNLLIDTITLLCKNGLDFRHQLKIEGVVGITLDDEDVFIVHIDEGLTADLNRTTRHVSTVTSTDEFTVSEENVQVKSEPTVNNELFSESEKGSSTKINSSAAKLESLQMREKLWDQTAQQRHDRSNNDATQSRFHRSPVSLQRKKVMRAHASPVYTENILNLHRSTLEEGQYIKLRGAGHATMQKKSFDADFAGSLQHVASNNFQDDTLRISNDSLPEVVYYSQLSEDENMFSCDNQRKIRRQARFKQFGSSSRDGCGVVNHITSDKHNHCDEMLAEERDRIRRERCREMNRIRVRRWRTKVKARCRANEETYMPSSIRLDDARHSRSNDVRLQQDSWNSEYLDALCVPDSEDLTHTEENRFNNQPLVELAIDNSESKVKLQQTSEHFNQ